MTPIVVKLKHFEFKLNIYMSILVLKIMLLSVIGSIFIKIERSFKEIYFCLIIELNCLKHLQ